jgi:hypothetical protein
MSRRALVASLCIASTLGLVATVNAQTAARPATIAKPAAPAANLGSLAPAVREEPSPTITSLKGVGTTNAVAEARMTQQTLKEFCSANAQQYASAAQCAGQFGNKTYRATADCTAGRITTTAELSYTLDGVWPKESDGGGATRWKDDSGSVVQPDLVNNGLYVSQQWSKLCPGPVTPALIARAKGGPAAPAARGTAAAARPTTAAATPSICGGQRLCDEVTTFAATITDFRQSQSGDWRSMAATVRFQNKTNRPLILGYVRTSSVAINEAGNRYTITDPKYVRGIGEIAGNEFDPKFTLQPGQSSDARFEFWWRWNGSEIIGVRAWDVALTIREVNEVAPGGYRFGQEHALQFKGAVPGNATSAAPSTPPASAPASAASQISANLPDQCAGRIRCYDAGPFFAEIVTVTPSIFKASYDWHVMTMNIRFTNKTTEPLVLAYVAESGALSDNFGNRYRPSSPPQDVKGMGISTAAKADPQFVLRPGESRAATFIQSRQLPRAGNQPMGMAYTFVVSIAQLQVLYNGQQIRTVREHSLTFADWPPSGTAAPAPPASSGGGAPAGAAPTGGGAPVIVSQADECAGKTRCYDAGNFVAEVVQVTPSIAKATYDWHVMTMNIRFRNKTNQPLVLAYVAGSGQLSDNFSNSYRPSSPPQDVKGMGILSGGKADPQFVLRPGESRAASFIHSRPLPRAGNQPMGQSYTFVLEIAELEVLYNGQQIRTQRENSLTLTGITAGGGALSGAAPQNGAEAAENIKKAGEAIRGLFGGKKK